MISNVAPSYKSLLRILTSVRVLVVELVVRRVYILILKWVEVVLSWFVFE